MKSKSKFTLAEKKRFHWKFTFIRQIEIDSSVRSVQMSKSLRVICSLVKKMSTTTDAANEALAVDIKKAKKKLRSEIDRILKGLSKENIETQSKQVQNRLFAMEEFQNAKRIGIYLSLPLEIDTTAIIERIFQLNKQCFVPQYTPKSTKMNFVEIKSMEDFNSLPIEPKWKIKQPDPNDDTRLEALSTGGLDLMLVPGVAFTIDGDRLGHGMGYYDRWQERCFKMEDIKHPTTIALALRQQLLEHVPVTKTDVRIHKILTPDIS